MIDDVIEDDGELLSEDILADEIPIENEILYDDEPDLLIEEPEEIELSDELILEEAEVINNELPQLGDAQISQESYPSNQESFNIDEILAYIEDQNEILEVINDNICTFEENLKLFETVSCCFLSFIIGCLLIYFLLGRLS